MKQVIRGTYFALSIVLSNTGGVNQFTMANLYRTCVLQRALFACELWNKIPRPDMMKLEVAYNMCLKHIQSLPHLTRSDMVTGLLGFTSIEAFIDLQKCCSLVLCAHLNHANFLTNCYACTNLNIQLQRQPMEIYTRYHPCFNKI